MRRRPILAIGVPVVAVVFLLCPLGAISLPQPVPDREAPGQRLHLGPGHASLGAWLNDDATGALTYEAGVLLVCAVGGGLVVATVAALHAWHGWRAEDAARLHARLVAALRRDRILRGLAVTPRVRLPLLGRGRPHVALRGEVPTLWLRYAVRNAVERETAAVVETYRIVDQMTINPEHETDSLAA
jgi:hypothetical protein